MVKKVREGVDSEQEGITQLVLLRTTGYDPGHYGIIVIIFAFGLQWGRHTLGIEFKGILPNREKMLVED